jgi:MFS family permease
MSLAMFVGVKVDVWGRKPLLLIACGALAFRGLIFAAFDSAPILVAAQVLDGLSACILDVVVPLMLADIVCGTGRYSMSRGVLGTIQGVGGSLSNVAAGTFVVWTGYSAAFALLAGFGALACVLALVMMPETARPQPHKR